MRLIITDTLLGPEVTGNPYFQGPFSVYHQVLIWQGTGSKGICPNFENCIVDASILINSCLLEI